MLHPVAMVHAYDPEQVDLYRDRAQRILQSMSIEERVGQVFLVSFTGSSIEGNPQLQDLIQQNRVGGVVLRLETIIFRSGKHLAKNAKFNYGYPDFKYAG